MILRGISGHQLGHHLGHVWGIIWHIPGTKSGAYCQQWTTISGASCICDAVFGKREVRGKLFLSKAAAAAACQTVPNFSLARHPTKIFSPASACKQARPRKGQR